MLVTDVITTVGELLTRQAATRPDQLAFRDERQSVSYRDLLERTARLAGQLHDAGLQTSDRMLMFLDNSVEVVEGYLVAPRAGIVTACANPQATAAELSHLLTDSAARAVLTDPAHLDTVMSVLAEGSPVELLIVAGAEPLPDRAIPAGIDVVRYDDLMSRPARHDADHAAGLDEWCWMLYTSGTTGPPKGVRLTQRGCLWVVGACWIPIAGLGPADLMLSALPLFHSYALDLCVLGVVAAGASQHLLPRFSPTTVLQRLADEPITFLPGVPTMFRYLLDTASTSTLNALALRLCVSAGALLPAALNTAFEEFSGVPLLDGYGITETSTMVTMNSATGGRFPGSCGLPLPGLSVRLVDPLTGTDAALGADGELWVQGPNVMQGYHNLAEATALVLTNGWYHTGDLAHRDENGFLHISGRLKEMIIRGGENIYPAEIEEVILGCDCVLDAAVVAAPHEALGEVPVAFVVAADSEHGIDRAEVTQRCAALLSAFKVPTEIIEVAEIPRTGSGKVQRFQLQRQLPTAIG